MLRFLVKLQFPANTPISLIYCCGYTVPDSFFVSVKPVFHEVSFSREVNYLELTHAQFDCYGYHIYAGSYSLYEKVSSKSFYFVTVEKNHLVAKWLYIPLHGIRTNQNYSALGKPSAEITIATRINTHALVIIVNNWFLVQI